MTPAVALGPSQPGSGEKLHAFAIDAGIHPIAVVFQLMHPLVARRRGDKAEPRMSAARRRLPKLRTRS